MRRTTRSSHVLDAGLQPAAILLPVLGILLVTSEWSQRTGMITFALVPVRSRVLGAKLIASLVLAVAMLVISVAVVAAGVLVASPGVDGTWSDAAPLIGQSAVYLTAGMIVGVALGAILLASAPAIVLLFALPTAWMAVVSLPVFSGVAPWVDYARALGQMTAEVMSATQWAHVGTALATLDAASAPDRHLADHAAGDRLVKALRRSAFDWPAGRSKGAPQLVLSAGGRRIDTQATGMGVRGVRRAPERRAMIGGRVPEPVR